jgi:type III restriction enzyme
MDLFKFQQDASAQIGERYGNYATNPLMVDRTTTLPFFQTLVSITGSGKTLILADTITQIQARMPMQPVVLWISKGRVLVAQTYTNLSDGKYADNLKGFSVKPLLELHPSDLENAERPLLLVATVAKFAREEDGGDRKVFKAQLDMASQSLWELLKARKNGANRRRPLIVVYDEGHNLSDLQTRRLLELSPDAIIAASATMSVPEQVEYLMARLRNERGWQPSEFTTTISSRDVVDVGLVKERISLGGYVTPMEAAVDALLQDMTSAREAAQALQEPFVPKAIYVCSTNAVDGVPISEDIKRAFKQRQARPILIWRHLVENRGIDPTKIAVYCQLKFSKEFPAPTTMQLFAGGDNDYAKFISGTYEHVIFNLSLQEGWDDPTCGFAYIDKEMASAGQITQVIGRVLRQPGAAHYSEPALNTAHFYIRTDEKGVFDEILRDIQRQLVAEHPAISLVIRKQNSSTSAERIAPEPNRSVSTIGINSHDAITAVQKVVSNMIDFRKDVTSTIGIGARMQVLQEIGVGSSATFEWVEVTHSNKVTARSVFRRELQVLYPGALRRGGGPINLVEIEHEKFDALIELNSPASKHVQETARKVVEAYIDNSRIFQNDFDPAYSVGPVAVDPSDNVEFNRSLHKCYSGLNDFELRFAQALDRSQRVWARNPVNTGFFLPLLALGGSATYWPDFLVWIDNTVVAIDTKGDHLLQSATAGKLFDIDTTPGNTAKVVLRLVSDGHTEIGANGGLTRISPKGLTVWRWRNGKPNSVHCEDEREAVKVALSL